ncbi:protocatechuate 4,5-dioxygenase subunit beta [Novosphingobium pentaromativorans]|uniref:Extradiol ring-cleavage dioxygenase class III enzyme subunit B domain-containing protein n=1 Tax=Novosphingobium pentaromativorans US6-1 TaxID=1088721 RepID=G6EGM0_9SPHN|nr:protocatechuate 4,5-dioxygenase subunit beta [Novosphingobium pentaromativorans]AIT82154.1 protocatechuate 3,4-dioxygenase [Novosphingobium pentaromativorans US6-1]EHJ59567.1 hypothetical protein NSU_3450 [Novosphingobium pentaromativorans US6-1]
MAQIVGGFVLPHNPGITMVPKQRWSPGKHEAIYGHFAEVGARVKALGADTAIVIGSDHYTCFGPHCIPSCLIAIGDVEMPFEDWLGFDRVAIANNEPLARHILDFGLRGGVDWAFAKAITVDHAIAIPYRLSLADNQDLKVIPIYLNSGISPLLSSRRAFALGDSVRRAIEAWPGDEKVVVLGTGGMSHWVGDEQMGRVNAEFDEDLMALIEANDVEALIALSDDEVEDAAGNGALEMKNFICAMAMTPAAKGRVIGYEAMPELITGLGFAELVV